MFRVLALHPGPNIGADAAAAMLALPLPRAEQILNSLARTHLINHDTARRYRFHDLLRMYAADRATHEETLDGRTEAMRRLLTWYLLTANNASARQEPNWEPVPDLPEPDGIVPCTFTTMGDAQSWYEIERANIAALIRAAAVHGLPRLGWQLAGTIYDLFERFGRQDAVLELNEIALAAAEQDGHLLGQIGVLNNIGATYTDLHDHRRAAERFAEALRLARSINFLSGELVCAHNLASSHLGFGDPATAIEIYKQVLGVWRATSHPVGEAATLHKLGDVSRQMRDYDQAVAYYLEALTIRERAESLSGQGATHSVLAELYLETGRLDLALDRCEHALGLHARTRDALSTCDTLVIRATTYLRLGRLAEATEDARQALTISEQLDDAQRRAAAQAVKAKLLAEGTGSRQLSE
jgi:tetratricopeptide (TPR) repeat protein